MGTARIILIVLLLFISLLNISPAFACDGYKGCASGDENPEPCNINFEQQVVEILNAIRVSQGLNPLKSNFQLTLAARYHAQDMACERYFDHDSYDRNEADSLVKVCGTWDRIQAFYRGAQGENCAAGYGSPQSVVDGWMSSPGHHDNMLWAHHWEIGVGYYFSPGSTHYWVMDLGNRYDYYPIIINLDSAVTKRSAVDLFIYGEGTWHEMRFKNNDQSWSEWQPFKSTLKWNLNKVNGEQTVWVEMRDSNRTTLSISSDEIILNLPTAVESNTTLNIVNQYLLFPNYPNPFNPETTISYQLNTAANVKLAIYNASGQNVKTLLNSFQQAGIYEQRWDGRDDQGMQMSAGVYFCRLQCGGDFVTTQKMVLLK